MELKFKRLKDSAVLPIRGTKGAAGIDLTCTNITTTLNEANQLMIVYHTDLAVEIPKGYLGLLVPRSSIWKKSLMLTDSLGIIDDDFRGEIVAIMKATTDTVPAIYKQGERFCQLVILEKPEYTIVEADELWNYNKESDELSLVFGFADAENTDARSMVSDHEIRLLKVDEEGNTAFVVSGYMNRGEHEGEVGVAVYYYDIAKLI